MFQYAITRTHAERIGCNFYIPGTPEEAAVFYTEMGSRFRAHLELPCPTNPHYWTGHGLFDLDLGTRDAVLNRMGEDSRPDGGGDGDGLFLHGFFQSESHFTHIREDVRRWFRVSDSVAERAAPILDRHPPDVTCYIHFRGGDYKDLPHWYLPRQYYQDAMDLVRGKCPGIGFLIVTDDMEEASSVLPGIEVVSNDPSADFCLLNSARWCIIPNSSFSWWACWLQEGNFVVAPHGWLNHNSGGDFNPQGVYTPRFNYIKRR